MLFHSWSSSCADPSYKKTHFLPARHLLHRRVPYESPLLVHSRWACLGSKEQEGAREGERKKERKRGREKEEKKRERERANRKRRTGRKRETEREIKRGTHHRERERELNKVTVCIYVFCDCSSDMSYSSCSINQFVQIAVYKITYLSVQAFLINYKVGKPASSMKQCHCMIYFEPEHIVENLLGCLKSKN